MSTQVSGSLFAVREDNASSEKQVQPKSESHVSVPRSARRSKKSESAFRTISEVADLLDVQQHVLRFWETKFSQIRPLKRGGGRRYYRPEDVALLQSIHHLLYTEGYTIKGVQKMLKEQGKNAVVQNNIPEEGAVVQPVVSSAPQKVSTVEGKVSMQGLNEKNRARLEDVLSELQELKSYFSTEQ